MADDVFSIVRDQMLSAYPEDEQGRMLQSPGLKTLGKFYAFATEDDVILKLPAQRVAELIERGEGLPCSPRPGSPMREWVRIPALTQESCMAYVLEARAFVSSTAP